MIFQKADVARMWEQRGNTLKAIFNGTIGSFSERIAKNVISNQTDTIVSSFKSLQSQGKLTIDVMKNLGTQAQEIGESQLSKTFADWAREGENAQISIEGIYAAILDGNTKGLGNVLDVIKTFNESVDPDDQEAFANAVSETNINLGEYLRTVKTGEASFTGYAGALIKTTAKTVGLTVATTALNTAISLGASLIVSAVVSSISNAIHFFEQSAENIQSAADAVAAATKNLKSYNDELGQNLIRLNELSKIESPTLLEQEEIDKLKSYNTELRERIRLEQYELAQKKESARKDSLNVWSTIFPSADTVLNGQTSSWFWNFITGKSVPKVDAALKDYENAVSKYQELQKRIDNEEQLSLSEQSQLEYWENEINTLKETILSFNDSVNVSTLLLGLDPEQDKEKIDWINKFLNTVDQISGKADTSLTDVLNNGEYALTVAQLKELAKEKKLTEETFGNVRGIEDFKEALRAIGIIDIDEVIRAINNEVQETGSSSEQAASSVGRLNTSLEVLKETIDATLSSQSTLQSTFDKMQEGTSLSADEVLKLVEIYPELASQFKRTVDGYKISSKALLAANEDITSSTRESITEQIEGYQKVIDNYNKLKSVSGMPENVRNERLRALGTTPKEIEDAEQQIEYLNLVIGILNTSLDEDASQVDKLKSKTEELAKAASSMSSKMKAMSSAFKEQKENGQLSADTILTLIDNGYAAALMYDKATGAVKLNEQAYLNLAKAELTAYEADLQTQITDAELELLNAKQGIVSNLGWSYLGAAEGALKFAEAEAVINNNPELIENLRAQLLAVQDLKDNLQSVITGEYGNNGSSDSTDKLKQDFDDFMNYWQLQYDRGLITAETYYSKLAEANEKFYKDCADHADDYQSNLTKIWEHEKDEWDKKAEAEKEALAEQQRLGYITQNAYDSGIIDIAERYYGRRAVIHSSALGAVNVNSTEWGQDKYKSLIGEASDNDQDQYKEDFQKELDNLNKQLEKGLLTVSAWRKKYAELRKNWWGEGSDWYGTSFASDMYDEMSETLENVDDLYDEQLTKIQKANDKSIESEQEYINNWRSLNEWFYKDVDNKKYESNRKEIADYELSVFDRMYSEGYLTAKEYFDKVTDLWNRNSDILGKDTQYEWLEEAWKKRAADEKTYWEQQKELAAQYYDDEIKKLQDVQEEEERVNKAEELRLNLIKARQALEDAKNNRNQLVFSNGTFEYMADQEAVISAEEEVAESLKAIKENELQEQISLLEQQKDEALLFYSNVIGLLEYYINGTREIESSDSEVLDRAINSESGNYFLRLLKGEVSLDDVKEELKQKFSDKPEPDTSKPDKKASMPEWASSILEMGTAGLFALTSQLISFAKVGADFGGIATSAQDIASMATDNIFNNSNITNDNSVNVGDIHMTIQGGTSQEMLDQFAHKLGSTISTLIPRAITS